LVDGKNDQNCVQSVWWWQYIIEIDEDVRRELQTDNNHATAILTFRNIVATNMHDWTHSEDKTLPSFTSFETLLMKDCCTNNDLLTPKTRLCLLSKLFWDWNLNGI
jgi:hypothetical protein